MRLATSSCSTIAGKWRHHLCFPARSCANPFYHTRLQTRIAGGSHQIDQPWCSASTADFTQIRGCFNPTRLCFFLTASSRYSLVLIFFPTLSSKCALMRLLLTAFLIEFRNRGNTGRTFATPGDTIIPERNGSTGFRAEKCFHTWIHSLPNSFTSQLYLMMGLTWWCAC